MIASEQAEAEIAQPCPKKTRLASGNEDGGEDSTSVGTELSGYDVAQDFYDWLLCFSKTRVCYSLHRTQLENTADEQKQSRQPKTNQSYAYAHKKFYVSDCLQTV